MIIGCTGNYRKEQYYIILEKIHSIIELIASELGVPICSATAAIGSTPKGIRPQVITVMLITLPLISRAACN